MLQRPQEQCKLQPELRKGEGKGQPKQLKQNEVQGHSQNILTSGRLAGEAGRAFEAAAGDMVYMRCHVNPDHDAATYTLSCFSQRQIGSVEVNAAKAAGTMQAAARTPQRWRERAAKAA